MATKQKRSRLLDIKRSDETENSGLNIKASPSKEIEEGIKINSDSLITRTENLNILANEYEKLSVSIPTPLFETLQDISRERRRAKQKHTMSQMVREALDLWLDNRKQSKSI